VYDERRWGLRNPVSSIAVAAALVAILVSVLGRGWSWFLLVPVAVLLCVATSNLHVAVEGGALRIAYWPAWRRTVPLSAIRSATIEPYSWLEHGGWGVRLRPGSVSYTVWEKHVVRVKLESGRDILLGSTRPEELARELAPRQRL
jgi:hypothetical protein